MSWTMKDYEYLEATGFQNKKQTVIYIAQFSKAIWNLQYALLSVGKEENRHPWQWFAKTTAKLKFAEFYQHVKHASFGPNNKNNINSNNPSSTSVLFLKTETITGTNPIWVVKWTIPSNPLSCCSDTIIAAPAMNPIRVAFERKSTIKPNL